MIELAPHNKQGLAVGAPLIAGSGAVGFGDAWPPGVTPAHFGAIVTTPISRTPVRGAPQPRLVELPGGFLLTTGAHNPGYRRVLREHAPNWTKLGVPVLVALAGNTPEDWPDLAARLEDQEGVAGIELSIGETADLTDVRATLRAARRATTLPLLVKLPVTWAEPLAEECAAAEADALVIGIPPTAAYPAADGALVHGAVAGPIALPFTLRALRAVVALGLGLPVVAAGGICCVEDARLCLETGATAIQVRSLLWTNPAAVARLAGGLEC